MKNKYTSHRDRGSKDVWGKSDFCSERLFESSRFRVVRYLWVGFMGTGATNIRI